MGLVTWWRRRREKQDMVRGIRRLAREAGLPIPPGMETVVGLALLTISLQAAKDGEAMIIHRGQPGRSQGEEALRH